MQTFRFLVLATAAAGGALLITGRARAHAVHATVTVTDVVKLEAFFDEELPAELADVTVTDADGNALLTGKTDERGVWTAPCPKPGTYTLTVRVTGHVARRVFTVSGPAEPDAPVVFGGQRLNKWVGLSIGVAILLGVSGASWLRRRRTHRLE